MSTNMSDSTVIIIMQVKERHATCPSVRHSHAERRQGSMTGHCFSTKVHSLERKVEARKRPTGRAVVDGFHELAAL